MASYSGMTRKLTYPSQAQASGSADRRLVKPGHVWIIHQRRYVVRERLRGPASGLHREAECPGLMYLAAFRCPPDGPGIHDGAVFRCPPREPLTPRRQVLKVVRACTVQREPLGDVLQEHAEWLGVEDGAPTQPGSKVAGDSRLTDAKSTVDENNQGGPTRCGEADPTVR